MEKIHTLLISDVHLGSESCQAELLLRTLQGFDCERLILAGDLYERDSVICDQQFEVLRYLRAHRKKIVYIDGNHDLSSRKSADRVLGVFVCRKYKWQMGQKQFCAMHGHQFDRLCFIFSEPLIDRMISYFILFLQRMDAAKLHIGKWLDNFHRSFAQHVAKRAYKHAKRHGFDCIVCGHSHIPAHYDFFDEKSGRAVEYFNCGSWVTDPCSFVAIDEKGRAKLHLVPLPKA